MLCTLEARRRLSSTALMASALLLMPLAAAADKDESETAEVRHVAVLAGDGEEGGQGASRVVAKVVRDDGSGPRIVYVSDDGEPAVIGSFRMPRGYLGVALLDITSDLRSHFGAAGDAGVLISKVDGGSPAADADLRVGDVLTAIDGEPVGHAHQVVRSIGRKEEGDVVTLDLLRDGRPLTLTATLAERERPQLDLGQILMRRCRGDEEDCELEGLELEIEDLPILGGLRFDGEALREAMKEMRAQMASPEWKSRMEALRRSREDLEENLRQLEERLREVERQLAETERDG